MKITFSHAVTLGSLCALLAGTATAALAQDNDHHQDQGQSQSQYRQHQSQYRQHQFDQRGQYGDGQYQHSDQYRRADQSERRRLDRLHAAYGRAAARGNYSAAERDHAHAQAIRARLHTQNGDPRRDDHQDQHDNNH